MNRFLVAMVLSTVRKMSAPSLPRRFIHLTPSPRPKYRGGVEVWVEALSRDFALVVASQEPFLRASGDTRFLHPSNVERAFILIAKQMVRLEALLFILRRWARPTKATSPSKKRLKEIRRHVRRRL